MLDQALSPTRGPLRANAAESFGWILGPFDGLLELLRGFNPRNHNTIRADIERAFDEAAVQLGNADERDGVAADGGAEMLDDVLPIEMAVFRINDDPIDTEGHGHFRDAGSFERDPQAVGRFICRQFFAERGDGGGFHDGTISFRSQPGVQTEFFVQLPVTTWKTQ